MRHIDNAHGELARPFTCEICGHVLKNLESLRSHAKSSHPGKIIKELKQDCFLCSQTFRLTHDLNKHLKEVHNHVVKHVRALTICDFCENTFTSKAKFIKHLKTKACPSLKTNNDISNDLNVTDDCVTSNDVFIKIEAE